MEELHRSGGVPPGWRFALPGGDPMKGGKVFVADRATGEPVPYLPVSASVSAPGKPARRVTLAPMVGGQGFHYGGNVALPDGAHTITVTIGPIATPVMPSARGRFAKPVTVVFERGT
jgi:uncharacterized protein involved in high-affinity Fe2+ transport